MPNLRRSKLLCALASALALAVFAGCGGDDGDEKSASGNTAEETTATEEATASEEATTSPPSGGDVSQYKEDFKTAGEDFKDAAQASAADVKSATETASKVQALEGLKGVVTDAADDFEALDPPADVKADHEKLVSQFRGIAGEVEAVKKALEANDETAAQAAVQRLQQAQAAIGETLASIESKVGG